jgi:2-polyprenyl-6-methoxyphenol hydroxylase-like FAD-dependent oxidoreductase
MRHDVLIIGAGPSGLFAAAELARRGVEARLIEREVQPHSEARATAIQPGTLEILDSVGLLPPFLDAAEHVRCSRLYGPDMAELAAMSHDGIDCRCKFQCSLPQYETQRLLEAHLASLGGVVERGVTATKVETDADGVFVELVHEDGKVETVRPSVVIGAGGAHSVTRHSMSKPLEGATYRGHFLVADIAMPAPFPRDEAGVVCGPDGLLLLAPLPGGRWISFQDLEEEGETVSAADVVARVQVRLGGKYRPTDVAWFAPFRMHRRIVSRLADAIRKGREVHAAVVDPIAAALQCNARAMIDVDYAGSPLVADYGRSGAGIEGPHPGQRYPDWTQLGGTSHHVLVFGPVTDAASLARLGRRWSGLVQISHNPSVDPARAGLPAGGVIMIRPDGHIGFRYPSA